MQCVSNQVALLKILLHAAKHPHANVDGVLLGSIENSVLHISDAIPLFHNSVELAGPTEIALEQIETYTQQPGRPRIVGFYYSDARFQAADISPISKRVADQILAKHEGSVLVLLDNKRLSSFLQEGLEGDLLPFDLFMHEGKAWKREVQNKLKLQDSSLKVLRDSFQSLVKQLVHCNLNDFDDHLDDLSKDFLNPELLVKH
jgi:hypothetical protein